ncbi:MAG: helix-turn-helix domain-containing protein [Gammaproteobacteria bacterium]|nr:helix-turn-helix domain-containing protein [Gammaproteobacteria bacterium]
MSRIFTRFEVTVEDGVEDFRGTVSHQRMDNLDVYEIYCNAPHRVYHPAMPGVQTGNAAIMIALQVEGEGAIRQSGRRDVIRPGDLTVFDVGREFELRLNGPVRQLVLSLPWKIVKKQMISSRRVTGLGIRGNRGIGSVASEFINSFAHELAAMGAIERQRLGRSLIDILNATVVSRLSQESLSNSEYVEFQLNSAQMYAEDNLRDPDLSPAVVAAALGVSERYLHKLFQSEDLSLTAFIWDRRLRNCRADLEDPSMAGRSITEIAHAWGFKSSSHFSRTFKKAFGLSPREVRAKRC